MFTKIVKKVKKAGGEIILPVIKPKKVLEKKEKVEEVQEKKSTEEKKDVDKK